MARHARYPEFIAARLGAGTTEAIDAVLLADETRQDFVRTAIDRLLAERKPHPPAPRPIRRPNPRRASVRPG